MKLTPLDIRHKEFKRGMRGYIDAEVDQFLDDVAEEFERVYKENVDLGDRIKNLLEQIAHFRAIEETLQKTLVSAQQSAGELKATAQKEAELIVRDADIRARSLVSDAESRARDVQSESTAAKQSADRDIAELRKHEAEFRFRFRQLLEGYLSQIGAYDSTTRELVGDLAKQAEILKAAIAAESVPDQPSRVLSAESDPAEPVAAVQREEAGEAEAHQAKPALAPRGSGEGRPWWEPAAPAEEAADTNTMEVAVPMAFSEAEVTVVHRSSGGIPFDDSDDLPFDLDGKAVDAELGV